MDEKILDGDRDRDRDRDALLPAPPQRRLTARQRRLSWGLGGLGAALRGLYVFVLHPAPEHIYSDMQGYVEWSQRLLGPRPQTIADTIHPPGMALYLASTYALDGSWRLTLWVQWMVACGAMAAIWGLARRLFGAQVALLALAIGAVYLPFIHYSGLFLAENPYTLAALVALWALACGLQAPAPAQRGGWGLAAGIAAGVAGSFKNAILGPAALTGAGLLAYALRQRERRIWPLATGAALGLAAVFVPLTWNCTRLNEGTLCLGATNTAMNVLMGHYGRCGMFRWRDAKHHTEFHFQSPTTVLRGYTAEAAFDFAAFDAAANARTALAWSVAHPGLALRLSVDNVTDLFMQRTLWPRAALGGHDLGALSQRLFWALVLLPAVAWTARRWRQLLALQRQALPELLLLLPLVGQMATVFVSVSEVRYRIPFDGLLITLAARAYVELWGRLSAGRGA